MRVGYEGLDRITLTGVRVFGRHGVLPTERAQGQHFIVDVVVHSDVGEAGHTDELEHTTNYAQMAALIEECVAGEPLNLIEALAQRIADRILQLGRISIIEVTVHKPAAPIPQEFADVSVTIIRAAGQCY